MSKVPAEALLLVLLAFGSARAQAPTGNVAGTVTDASRGVLAGVRVSILNVDTGQTRATVTSADGRYSADSLPPGTYRVTAEADGFKKLHRDTPIEAGTTTTVNLVMELGDVGATVTVSAVAPLLHYEHHHVGGVVTREQIESLPLNGRNFLELAKLEPGVTEPTRASNNRTVVPVLGAPGGNLNGSRTRVTVDGGSVMQIANGGSAMGFSQEVIREFQISSVNFDLSTGVTASGAINIVTRSGGNELHGSGFYFLRDHRLSAYPALTRDPADPDPFFQRRQYGFSLGGPLRKERAFFFANVERSDQRSVVTIQPRTPEFAGFAQIAPSPSNGTQMSARLDLRANQKNYAYLRYSHDGNHGFAPSTLTGTAESALPSNWQRQVAWADQMLGALTTTLRPNLINELRFSYFFISSAEHIPGPADCPRGCIGLGSPQIQVPDAVFTIGSSTDAPNLGRRYHFSDGITWQKASHRRQLGLDIEYIRGGLTLQSNEPVSMVLFSPARVREYNALPQTTPELRIPLPPSFATVEDILQLPIQNFAVGIGDPRTVNFGKPVTSQVWRVYFMDTWRLHPRLTLNGGLAWSYDTEVNDGLSKPAYLEPILGAGGLAPTRKDLNNFSPSLGFAWTATSDGKTVIRGGAGVYYDANLLSPDVERQSLGPRGTGRKSYPSSSILNATPNIPGVPLGTALNFQNPTLFTGATLMQVLADLRADLTRLHGDPNNRDFSVRNIEVDKQGTVIASDFATPYATHVNLGIQRELTRDLVVSADFAYRKFMRNPTMGGSDYNHFNSVRGPILPVCLPVQSADPKALCSRGTINVINSIRRARYQGLLVRAEKRFSRRTQFLASYALSSAAGNNGTGVGSGFNNDNWFENYGPLDRIARHTLNVSGVVDLPGRFQIGFSSAFYTKIPFSTWVSGVDFNGEGTNGDLLPGTTVNQFNLGPGHAELARLVDEFNRTLAGKRTSRNQLIPTITLPNTYEFGDNYVTQDLRLSRVFMVRAKYTLRLLGEVFNLFNVANLQGYSGDLRNAATFGQPTLRVDQVFGSGGPRSFQLAARVSF